MRFFESLRRFGLNTDQNRSNPKSQGPRRDGLSEKAQTNESPEGGQDQQLSTVHLLHDLKGRTVSSGLVTITSQGVQFALSLLSNMVLARLLAPRDFGLVAMVWTVLAFLRIFKDAGLSTATVQREGITQAQISNLFWINLAVGGFISLVVAALSPVVAWFYQEPMLTGVTTALSASFLLAGANVQHLALLNRQMRFKLIALIQISSTLAGIAVGVSMALLKCSYWSLVGLNLTTSIVGLLLTWSTLRWRPQRFTRRSGTRPLLHFGANLTAGAFFYSLARGMDSLLIGRFYGPTSVGFYSRASAMLTRPLEQFFVPLETVFLPAFSRLQNQSERYRKTFLSFFEGVALFSCLFAALFFSLAHPLTLILLGPKWEKSATIFACFSFAALQYPVTTATTWLFSSQGRGRDSMHASMLVSMIVVGSFLAGLPFGAVGVATAYSAGCLLLQMPILYWLAGRSGPVGSRDLWMGFIRHLPVWVIVSGVVWLVRLPIPDGQFFKQFLIAAPAGFIAGGAFILLYSPSRRVAFDLLSLVRELKNPVQKPAEGQAMTPLRAPEARNTEVRVSVIIPTYNREAFVVKALDSVLRQTFKDYEIIVVDDGSTDNTRAVLQAYANQIKYIYQNNAGVGAARNAGVALAAGEWIAFLDSDDEWSADYLAKQIRAADRNPDVCMQITDCRYSDSRGEQPSYYEVNGASKRFNGADYLRPREAFVFLIHHLAWQIGSTVIRREALQKAGPFDVHLRISEDQDMMARVALQGPVGLLKDKLVTAYRRNERIENLSRIAKAHPIRSRGSDEGMYHKLESIQTLSRTQRRALKWVRSANQRAIGNLFLAEGKWKAARRAYWMAVLIQPSARSVAKYLSSFLRRRSGLMPAESQLWVNRQTSEHRTELRNTTTDNPPV